MAYAAGCDAGSRPGQGLPDGPGPQEGPGPPETLKILVAGGFGAGKTTFVGAVSEIEPLSTEELLSGPGEGVDPLDGTGAKTTTTVALDFGRITLDGHRVLYLFGTPGQQRFWFLWEELCAGALGAVVLADTRRLADCFAAVDFFERRGIGFIVAVNEFEGGHRYPAAEIREAVGLAPEVPVVRCDARLTGSGTGVLAVLVHHLLTTAKASESGEP
ncbi:ATP/GTP-binding protein [Streptomyces sp. G-G2]|uniref:GTP-binding protein n=1 Tax=Streptomyces sp. G-G2 TaxID=3046201 RepID=UPI0024BB82B6|nr:ATP/GTP-binding protein [Streptomyces sp. G-G2]MDJ0382605.1 ATP/GTP-binding protein [Streptomyces sp. G-G2]